MKSKKISGSIYYKTRKKLRPLTISFYNSYTVSRLADAKPVKPGILALTPKASRCWQVFWLSWFFANLPIPKI